MSLDGYQFERRGNVVSPRRQRDRNHSLEPLQNAIGPAITGYRDFPTQAIKEEGQGCDPHFA